MSAYQSRMTSCLSCFTVECRLLYYLRLYTILGVVTFTHPLTVITRCGRHHTSDRPKYVALFFSEMTRCGWKDVDRLTKRDETFGGSEQQSPISDLWRRHRLKVRPVEIHQPGRCRRISSNAMSRSRFREQRTWRPFQEDGFCTGYGWAAQLMFSKRVTWSSGAILPLIFLV